MRKEIIIAGFGGQGVMSIGKNLAESGVEEGLEVTWVPSYGPEMRGGTANCSVILSDSRIGTPLIEDATEVIVMNRPSLSKFLDNVMPGGSIFINSSTIPDEVDRDDINVYRIPCDDIALKLGNPQISNMVMLGAYLGATKALKVSTVEGMIRHMFSGTKAHLIDLNLEALKAGMESVEN